MAYDIDTAGRGAATFGASELSALVGEAQRRGIERLTDVTVVRLPEGKDPDEVMRDTPDAWREATEKPEPIMEYIIDSQARRFDLRTSGRVANASSKRSCRCCAASQIRPNVTPTCAASPSAAGSRSGRCWKSCAGRHR